MRGLLLLVCGLSLLLSGAAQAQGPGPARADLDRAVQRGLSYLAKAQHADGSWPTRKADRSSGIMGLAVMAFLANGHLPGSGRYGEVVRRGVTNLWSMQHPDGLIIAPRCSHAMYNHGLATIALAEAYGTSSDIAFERRGRRALKAAVELIIRTQADDGGWGYLPRKGSHDVTVSVMQLMALRAARNAGVFVPKESMERGVAYVESCYNSPLGGFGYRPGGGKVSSATTAAGVVSLQVCGRLARKDERLRRGLEYLRGARVGASGYYYYEAYYVAQAAFQAGGEHWRLLFPRLAGDLLTRQTSDGRWKGDPVYGTAVAVLVLSARNRYLPIYVEEERAK